MRRLILTLAAVLIAAPAITPVMAQDMSQGMVPEHMIARQSPHDVATTIDRLESALTEAGITVFGRIDHGANAAGAGLELPPTTLLIFGNPRLGTPLMQSERTIGLDLPLKALAWQDADGQVWLGYADPAALADRYAIEARQEVIQRMTGALDTFAGQAVADE
jgi:uncharacterized protein (DUF302 family)